MSDDAKVRPTLGDVLRELDRLGIHADGYRIVPPYTRSVIAMDHATAALAALTEETK